MLTNKSQIDTHYNSRTKNANYLQLQNGSNEVKLYTTSDNQWVIVENGQTRLLNPGDELKIIQGGYWKYIVDDQRTHDLPRPKLHFTFEASPDFEHISFTIESKEKKNRFPNKAMNYTLYLLAKQMHEDVQNDFYSDGEKGWINTDSLVDILKKELCNNEIDVYYLNVQIYRLRKAFSKTIYAPFIMKLIERRTGQVRFNHQNLSIKEYITQ